MVTASSARWQARIATLRSQIAAGGRRPGDPEIAEEFKTEQQKKEERLQIEQQIQKEQAKGTLRVSVGERRRVLQEERGIRRTTPRDVWITGTAEQRVSIEGAPRRGIKTVVDTRVTKKDITKYFKPDYTKYVVQPEEKKVKPTYIYKEPVQETRMDLAPTFPFGVTIPTQFEKAMGKGEPEKGLVREAPSTFTEILRKTYRETKPSEFDIFGYDILRGGAALGTTITEKIKRYKPSGYITGAPSLGAVGGAIGTFGVSVIGAPIEIIRKPVTSAKEIFYEFPKRVVTKPVETFREERKAFMEEPASYTGALVGTYYTLRGAGKVYKKTIGVKPTYEKIKITKGKTYDVIGLQREAGAYPLISKTPEGYLEFGRPKIDITSQLLKGKAPGTPLETSIYLKEAKKLLPTEEYGKIKAQRTIFSVTEKVKSKFIGTFPKEIKTLSPKGTKIVREFAKKEEAEVYGSYGVKAQMPEVIRGREVPTPSDIDIQTSLSEAETIARTKKLAERLKASGENVRVSPRNPTLIESYDPKTKTYHHAVDIHSLEKKLDYATGEEYRFGYKLGQPTIKIEGIETKPLSEQAIRKGGSAITLRAEKIKPSEPITKQDILGIKYKRGLPLKEKYYEWKLRRGAKPETEIKLKGLYQPKKDIVIISKGLKGEERIPTLIHERTHQLEISKGYDFRELGKRKLGIVEKEFVKVGKETVGIKKTKELLRGFKEELSLYPKEEYAPEFIARFAQTFPKEIIKPTTTTGRGLQQLYKEGRGKYRYYVAPEKWRMKDIPHAILTEMTLLESMKGFSFDPFRPVKRAIGEKALVRYQELVGDVGVKGITGEAVKIQIYKPTPKEISPAGAYPPIKPYIKPSPKITPSLEISEGVSPFVSEPISPYIKPSPKVSEGVSPFVSESLKPSPKVSLYVGIPSPKISPTVETVSPKVSVSVAEAEPSPYIKAIPTKRRPSPRIRARKYGEYVITDRYGYEYYPKEKPKITKTYFYPRTPPAVTETTTTKMFGGKLPEEKVEKRKGIWGMESYQLFKYTPKITAIEYGKTIKKTPKPRTKFTGIEERPVSLEQLRRPRKGLIPTLRLFEKRGKRKRNK